MILTKINKILEKMSNGERKEELKLKQSWY